MPSLTFILAGLLALVIAAGAGYYKGDTDGDNNRAVKDQKQFDATNAQIAQNKAIAASDLAKIVAANMLLEQQRDILKTQLEKDHAKAQSVTDDLRQQLATRSLSFRTAEIAGCGSGSGAAPGTATGPGVSAATVIVQLPDKVTSDLRLLALDADRLRDNYTLCYADDQQVK